jgi:hypothetical protein
VGHPDQRRDGGALTLRLGVEASGPIPVPTAWERYERVELWPRWAPQIRSVTTTGPTTPPTTPPAASATRSPRLAAGLTGRIVGPLGVWVEFTVLDVDREAHRWAWQVRRGPLALHLEHGVEPAAGGRTVRRPEDITQPAASAGSRAWLVVSGPAPVVLGYAPAAWIALRRLVTATDVESEA